MKGAMPAPGPTMTTGTDGSSGKWKECAARGEMDIWNIRTTVVSVKDTPDASADPRWPPLKKSKRPHSHSTKQCSIGKLDTAVTTESRLVPLANFWFSPKAVVF